MQAETKNIKEKFKAIDIHILRNVTRDISFDIYLKISDDNMAHIFSKTTGLDYKRLAQYIHKGVKELYIHVEDESAYKNFISVTVDSIINDPSATTEKKIATLLNMTEQNMAELFTQLNIEEDTATKAQIVVRNYVHLMSESPKTLAIILQLVSHGEYLYYHSIAVAIFSMLLAKASGQFKQKFLETIGMGGFLHDIGCTQIPKETLNSPRELTVAQWKEIRTHPKLGLNMIEQTPILSDEVRYIVYQHHEKMDGQGYPNGLLGSVIYYPAKIVSIADAFSALISNRPFRAAYTVPQAIKIIQKENSHFDKDLVKLLSPLFLKTH
ncbi:MAG: HD domain-containing protein [Deltaproteobacteria bacterium]|nr:HD domain-containing protein [Deltaproteobacteria bacterium]